MKLLRNKFDLEVNPYDRALSNQEILNGLSGKDGLLCLLADTIDQELITQNPQLKMIANYAVGYDNIDVEAATKQGIPVSNTPDVLTDATAEMAWALLFSVSRRIVHADTFTRSGEFKGWAPMLMLGLDVSGKTLGIIGAGRIGTAVGVKSKGFKMKVVYVAHHQNKTLEEAVDAQKVSLDELLRRSDFITLHVPLTESTFHMIGKKELRMMKNNAVLINTSRGPVVDENALITALQEKWIFGAGLDVYENEPNIPQSLFDLENVVLQPHSASATLQSRTDMAILAAENMIAGLHGVVPPNCINPEVFEQLKEDAE
jgi:lactate dehydrogenase-like 2-hydroxyacid dehydrogenase